MRARDPGPARCGFSAAAGCGCVRERMAAGARDDIFVREYRRRQRVRLKQGAGFARGKCSGAAAAKAHTSRVRAPGRACVRRHRFDRDRIPVATTSGMWPVALGRADVRVSALGQSPLGALRLLGDWNTGST